jgi:hypothetical protein
MNQHFNSSGLRYYSSNAPSLVRAAAQDEQLPAYKVYGFRVLTDTVLHADTTFAPGYDGDSNLIGVTLTPGDHFMRLSAFRAASGTGYLYLEG